MILGERLLLLSRTRPKFRRSLQAKTSEHEALQGQLNRKLMKVYNSYNRGNIDADEFKNRFQRELVKGYESAFRVGKGDEKLSNKDRRRINSFAADQFEHLDGFVDDLKAGNEPISHEARVKLYGNSVQAPYWMGAASDFDGPLDWVLGMNSNNCDSCIDLADGSPYDPQDLPTYPGAGDTECFSNCQCSLVSIT